jgi:single-strand DNA-binding protein
MEHINRIEIQGRVGTVRTNIVNETMVANFSVATDYLYKSKDNSGVSETTWHNVVAWAGKDMPDLRRITKGTPIYVSGRMRTSKVTSSDGTEKYFYEILANRLRILRNEENEA